ncbi:hypothetical protein [Pendulispora albinea]|uniref:Secreted protein n=1 Tax=Pendulispora albinea TaxID=2741071 RepID=A0ABZ2M261_9BACT
MRTISTNFGMRHWFSGVIPLIILGATGAACTDFNTSRTAPPRGTVGEDLYGILCDRVAAQALREDLNGSSFSAICHKPEGGQYANEVDSNRLPPLSADLKDVNGQPVPLETQQNMRDHALSRIKALVRRRDQLIAAFDATFPDIRIPVVDERNGDPAQTCKVVDDTTAGERGRLTQQLSDMLGKLQALYNDGTIPRTTQAVARLMDDIRATEAQTTREGLARFEARRGYKPEVVEQGSMRPIVGYPKLRDLSNAALRLLSADSDPYAENAPIDASGRRIPVAGPAHPQFAKLLEVAHEELRTFKPDPWSPAPTGVSGDLAQRPLLTRDRTTLEVVDYLMKMQDPAYAQGDAPLYLSMRDSRGYAAVPLVGGAVPAPFTDPLKIGLPALDNVGQFITSDGKPAPSPFPAPGGGAAAARDAFGRALVKPGGEPLYSVIDTSQTFANALLKNLPPLIDPDPAKKHETLFDLIAGLEVLAGTRDGGYKSKREYAPDPKRVDDWKLTHPPEEPPPADLGTKKVVVDYDAYQRNGAPLLDLIWAAGAVLGDPMGDDVLALVQKLLKEKLGTVARLTGTGLELKGIADKHPEAKIPVKSALWDEVLDILTEIAKEPTGLLEEMLTALTDERVAQLGPVFGGQMKFKDRISYDRKNISGLPANGNPPWLLPYNQTTKTNEEPKTPVDRSLPDSAGNRPEEDNRSIFQRFAQLVAHSHGVTVCNSDDAVVHARGVPLLGEIDMPVNIPIVHPNGKPLKECSFQKVDDAATFFLDSIVHKAQLYLRYDEARDGIDIIGLKLLPATVDLFEQSSAMRGFWQSSDATQPNSDLLIQPKGSGSRTFIPTPRWLARLLFFDHKTDTENAITGNFIKDLFGRMDKGKRQIPHTGSSVCKERSIPDPCKGQAGRDNGCTAESGAPDVIHNLRDCEPGQWLDETDDYTLFITENFGFFDRIKPLLLPLTKRNREDLFIRLMEAFNRHWQSDKVQAKECPSPFFCTRDGASSYEPLLSEQFMTDLLPTLRDTLLVLKNEVKIDRCTAVTNGKCTATKAGVDGLTILADGTRALLNPDIAKARKVTNRDGSVEGLRNDGTKNPQVTPMYLVLQALNKFDAAFVDWKAKHPDDDRLVLWRRARSQLVDQFLTVNGKGTSATFANPVTPPLLPQLVKLLREQLLAHCADTFVTGNNATCKWAREELATKLGDVTSGPLFSSALDVVEAIRKDSSARSEIAKLLLYTTDPKSVNEARKTMLTTLVDFPQLLADDSLTPLIHTLAEGAAASLVDTQGNVVRTGVVDAVTALLARLSGRAYTADGVEHCGRELDPNQVLTIALQNIVKPMPATGGTTPQSPLEIIIDTIADVNRVNPDDASKLQAPDYGTMTQNVSEFLSDKERGLEQFYEIVRQGTRGQGN